MILHKKICKPDLICDMCLFAFYLLYVKLHCNVLLQDIMKKYKEKIINCVQTNFNMTGTIKLK